MAPGCIRPTDPLMAPSNYMGPQASTLPSVGKLATHMRMVSLKQQDLKTPPSHQRVSIVVLQGGPIQKAKLSSSLVPLLPRARGIRWPGGRLGGCVYYISFRLVHTAQPAYLVIHQFSDLSLLSSLQSCLCSLLMHSSVFLSFPPLCHMFVYCSDASLPWPLGPGYLWGIFHVS